MATRVETLRRNKSRADEHAFNRQVSIDEAKRTAAWIFKTVNELPWQQKAVFLTVAISLVAGGVNFVQHNNIGGAKDNFKAWAGAFNLTDGGDNPVVILTPTPDVTVGVNRPQLIPPAGDMSTPTAIKSTEIFTPTATEQSISTQIPTPENKIGTIIFERKTPITQSTFDTLKTNPKFPVEIGSFLPGTNKDKKLVDGSIVVLPVKIYLGRGIDSKRIFCDCYIDQYTISTIEVGVVSVWDGGIVTKIDANNYGAQFAGEGIFASLNYIPRSGQTYKGVTEDQIKDKLLGVVSDISERQLVLGK